MKKHRSALVLIVLLGAGQVGFDHRSPEPATEVSTGVPGVADGSGAVRLVDWPRGRFAAAGPGRLPADMGVHDSKTGCDGHWVSALLCTLRSTAFPALTIDGAESSPADHGGPELAPVADTLQIVGADAELAATIREAAARFESVGLALPELSIHAHPTSAGCGGSCGRFTAAGSGGRVDLCVRVQYTILHELAHAWEYHNLDDAIRQRFLVHSGLEAWNDAETDWDERGVEAAVQTIAWGLLDIPITHADRFEHQLDQFELLTGFESTRL